MNNYERARKLLTTNLTNSTNTKLIEIATHMLLFGWEQGYCEVTENEEVLSILKNGTPEQLFCKWCGKFHYNTQGEDYKIHQKLASIPKEEFDKARDKFPDILSPELLARTAKLI